MHVSSSKNRNARTKGATEMNTKTDSSDKPERDYHSEDGIVRRYQKTCKHCGRTFYSLAKNRKYCCEKCVREAENKRKIRRNEERIDLRHAQKAMKGVATGALDRRLEEARARGMTYAELQKEKTLELIRQGKL